MDVELEFPGGVWFLKPVCQLKRELFCTMHHLIMLLSFGWMLVFVFYLYYTLLLIDHVYRFLGAISSLLLWLSACHPPKII